MTLSNAIVTALLEDPELAGLLVSGEEVRVYAASSLGEGENPQFPPTPHLVWNELPSTAFGEVDETSDAQQRVFTFYVYDEAGSFDRINQILRGVRRVVKRMGSFQAGDDGFCMDARWAGFSQTFRDPTYDTSVRFGTARFVTSS